MGDVMSLDQLDKVKADTEEILEDIASMTGQLNELWWDAIGAKPSSNAVKTSVQHKAVAAEDSSGNQDDFYPSSTVTLCDVTGKGMLFAAVVHKNEFGKVWLKIMIDGKEIILDSKYTDLELYIGYYATASCDGNNLPTSFAIPISSIDDSISVSEENLLSGNYTRRGSAVTKYPLTFAESLKVEAAIVYEGNRSSMNSTNVTYELK